jgi:hypothetical protein
MNKYFLIFIINLTCILHAKKLDHVTKHQVLNNQGRNIASNFLPIEDELYITHLNEVQTNHLKQEDITLSGTELKVQGRCVDKAGPVIFKSNQLIENNLMAPCLLGHFEKILSFDLGAGQLEVKQEYFNQEIFDTRFIKIKPSSMVSLKIQINPEVENKYEINFDLAVKDPNFSQYKHYKLGGSFFRFHDSGVFPSTKPYLVNSIIELGPINSKPIQDTNLAQLKCEYKNLKSEQDRWVHVVNEDDFVIKIHCE